jgi:hypothetical protein
MDHPVERAAGVAGLLGIVTGLGAATLERPWPDSAKAQELARFVEDNRGALLCQSILFVFSAALMMVFLVGVRSRLSRGEREPAPLASLAFGAGVFGYGANIVGQAPQFVLTLPSGSGLVPSSAALLTDLGFVLLALANLPLAVMFAAIAVDTLTSGSFPAWTGWWAAAAALGDVALALSVAAPTGPLAAQGWLAYVLYLLPVVWLVTAAGLLVKRHVARSPALV